MPPRPIQPQGGGRSRAKVTSLMAKSGMNKRDLEQLLSTAHATDIINYILSADGGLIKRGGLRLEFDKETDLGISMCAQWGKDILFGWNGTYLTAYDTIGGGFTNIKTDFNSEVTGGKAYGGYFLVSSIGDTTARVTRTLDYDAQSANFTAGLVLTGATSGATAVIQQDSDAGATGTLTLWEIEGTFVDNEIITDSSTGSATVNGTLGYTYSSISGAPKAGVLNIFNSRLFLGNLSEESSATVYSNFDSGSNPPFTSFTTTTTSTGAGRVSFKAAGAVKVIENLGDVIIVGHERGKFAFTIDVIDSSGSLVKKDSVIMERLDGGMMAALQTKEGLMYVNNQGLWQLVAVGQSNIKFSDQEMLTSGILGNNFFENADFSDATLAKDDTKNLLLISYKNDSSVHNRVLCYNTQIKGYSYFTAWNIRRFLTVGDKIYGAGSSVSKVWEIFNGNDDAGADIWHQFTQPISFANLWGRKGMKGQYFNGQLSTGTDMKIYFDIYDRDGVKVKNKLVLVWSPSQGIGVLDEFGVAKWGEAVWGGDSDSIAAIDSFAGSRHSIAEFQRLIITFAGHDKAPHSINWFSLDLVDKGDIRKRNITIA